MRRVVCTGGRDYSDHGMVDDVLDFLDPDEVFVGDCPTGADKAVLLWCQDRSVAYKKFDADWIAYGNPAGPIRNLQMVKEAGINAVVVAFPGGRGTNDCVRSAKNLNLIVLRVEA